MSATPAGNTDYEMLRAFKPGGVPTPVGGVNEERRLPSAVNGATVIAQLNTPLYGWIGSTCPRPRGACSTPTSATTTSHAGQGRPRTSRAIQYNLCSWRRPSSSSTAPP